MRKAMERPGSAAHNHLLGWGNSRQGGEGGATWEKTSPSPSNTTSGAAATKRRRGAQPGNRQALKSGRYTAENRALRRYISDFIEKANALVALVDARHGFKPGRRRKSR